MLQLYLGHMFISREHSFVSVFYMYVCGRISYPYVRLLGCAAVYMTIVKYCCGAFACFEIEPGLVVSPVPSAHLLAAAASVCTVP